jgi:hypothetical protein
MYCIVNSRHPTKKSSTDDASTRLVEIAVVEVRRSQDSADSRLNVLYAKHTELSQPRQLPSLIDKHVVLTQLAGVYTTVKTQELSPRILAHGYTLAQPYSLVKL